MTVKTDLEDLFLRKKPIKLLMSLRTGDVKYISMLAKETDCTYSHTVKLLDKFSELGIVNFSKKGRVKFIELTAEGGELAKNFENVLRKFSKMKSK
ncbi:MAG: winged helix-turn-helix transcriptional regulator [Candidatus Aenigmarchaeota archaeon]|nr:winged helix-turn-helix transcriptional regulator [Candidatus Aenigmarchaeota archaeon]